jgi:molybdopterin molybdotransferase
MSTDPPPAPPPQRIARLTPVREVHARIDALVAPIAPQAVELRAAIGRVLAADAVAPAGMPMAARALRDGFAVRAETTADAGSYTPALLATVHRVDLGDLMPPDADAVVPLDAVALDNGRHQVVAPVAAGEGVLATGADIRAGEILFRSGERLRTTGAAVLAAAGIAQVMVREPRIRLVPARADREAVLAAAHDLMARAIAAMGAKMTFATPPAQAADLGAALGDATADAVIVIGGTGSGSRDASVHRLARAGRVEVHGIALSPGETAAFGRVHARPVLLLPGRLDAALAVWLVLGRRMLARLAGGIADAPASGAKLARKVASPLGLADVVPVRLRDGVAEPLASGYWPLAAIAQADGWILVHPDSEGYPAGSEVVVRPFL